MAEQKSSAVTYHEYDIPRLNAVFAWSSAGFLLVSLWMIWADYDREFKDYQRRFNDAEIARTAAAIESAEGAIDPGKLAAVEARRAQAEEGLAGKKGEIDAIERQIDDLAGRWYAADQSFRFAKADLDVARYELDEALKSGHAVQAKQAEFDEITREVDERRVAFEKLDAEKATLEARRAELEKEKTAAAKDIEALRKEKSRLEKRLGNIEHSFVKDYFRDRPLVDFLAPTIKVQQVVLPQLHADVNFMTVPRVDRCHSCHLAIDKPGWTEDSLPPEFRSHSRFDVTIGNHPVEQFGCTGCHAGSGLAITFVDASHAPRDAAQEKEWEERFHWHRLHHWDFPQLPLAYTEANCVNCHKQESRVPGADKLNAGRELIEELGCFGCHKIDRPGFRDLRKVGPDLARIRGKVSKEWLYKWVEEPRSFRPTTRMPRIWGNSNTAEKTRFMDYPLRDKVEIEAVVRYLASKSGDYADLPKPSGTGDPARGKWVVENRGCQACHVVGAGDTGEGRARSDFGPNLNQVGSKLSLDWLYAWIRDPKSLWPDTRMPDLRLTDQEALDAASYLLTLENPEFEKRPLPELGAEAAAMRKAVVHEYLLKEMTKADAEARLGELEKDEDASYEYLGRKIIARQGCFGCHPGIPGFESAQPIGTELTEWASKLLTQLDFGLLHDQMPHTKHDWLRAKLLDPRRFDHGKVESKHPQDLLRMPNFLLTEEQTDLIMTAVLGFQRDLVQAPAHRNLDAGETAIEEGRRLVRRFNCQGCHVVEDFGGGMEKVVEGGAAFAPPVLEASFRMPDGRTGRTHQGAKVQADWFFRFLKAPTVIRPWVNLRMPTFGMSDAEATAVIRYFSELAGEKLPYDYLDRASIEPALVDEGSRLFAQKQCINCHLPLEEAKKRGVKPEELAPNLELAKDRLKYGWLVRWLEEPGFVQKDTRMPSFFKYWDEDEKAYRTLTPRADQEIEALRAYLQFHGGAAPAATVAARR